VLQSPLGAEGHVSMLAPPRNRLKVTCCQKD